MWINNLYLTIHSQRWGAMRVDHAYSHMPNDFSPHDALSIWFEIFKIIKQQIKFRVPFVKHLAKSLLAAHVKHTWWCDGTSHSDQPI